MTYEISESNKNRVYSWLFNEPCQSYIYREFNSGLQPGVSESKGSNTSFVCALCKCVPRHPLISKCKHLFCSSCLVHLFSTSLHQQNDSWVVNCTLCQSTVMHSDLNRIRFDAPASSVDTFYASTMFQCTNKGCTMNLHYNNINEHEWLWCQSRMIHCPGRNCQPIACADEMLNHISQCPCMEVYCDTCETAFDVSVSSHICALVLKKRLYNERNGRRAEGAIKNHSNQQIVLPVNLPIVDLVEQDLKKISDIIASHSNQRIGTVLTREKALTK
jgi:hypothetical protein